MLQLTHIYPFAICKTLDVFEDNFGSVLREFMLELREFESAEEMALNIPDLHNFRIRGTIVSVYWDTKGAHEIGGFKSQSDNKFGHLCLIDRPEINLKSNR
jgi:hypothetical protein